MLWFGRAGTQVHLIVTEGATAPLLGHAAFAVDDFDATVAALRERGFEFEESRELWGERRGFLLAPGGHRMELMAAPPPCAWPASAEFAGAGSGRARRSRS